MTYEPLASYDAGGSLVPFLGAEIPSIENGGVAAVVSAASFDFTTSITRCGDDASPHCPVSSDRR
jgi:hypothetical protein